MIGSNTLTLNTATLIEALQEYLDKRITEAAQVEVKNIKVLTINGIPQFEVSIDRSAEKGT